MLPIAGYACEDTGLTRKVVLMFSRIYRAAIAASLTLPACVLLLLLIAMAPGGAQTVSYFQTGEEFSGPFPSWKNVKTDFGAKGDGVTDDAPAINRALAQMKTSVNNWCVLYFPAGTYLINSTVYNAGRNNQDNNGMSLVGEDPVTTSVKCGKAFAVSDLGQGAMLRLDGMCGKISRLTLEGNGIAKIGLLRDGGYGTDWRITDLMINNVGVGVQFGGASNKGQDISVVTRCRFTRCGTGITATNQNAITLQSWYNLFEDCGVGMDNGVGYVHSIGNVYLRSKECDINNGYIGYMILQNTSINSERFLGFIEEKTVCMAIGNKIYDTKSPVSLWGVDVMLDNVVRSRKTTGPALLTGKQNTLMVGNTFTVTSPAEPMLTPAYAIDHDPRTVCFDPNALKFSAQPPDTAGFTLTWTLPGTNTETVSQYAITTGDIPVSDPQAFQLQGSTDGVRWTTLDSRGDQHWTARGEKRTFTIANPALYHQYRLYVTENQNTPINICGDRKGGVGVAEWELLTAQGKDITKDKGGTITARQRDYSLGYTAIDEKLVAPNSLPVPTVVRLPGVPMNRHRKVFEVKSGTGDDAQEIQRRIDAAALEPAGSNPVIHLPKGDYQLKRTVIFPAGKAMQFIGDAGRGGSSMSWSGTGTGPMFRLLGPSRVLITDCHLSGINADVMTLEQCDQDGGRIYCDQINCYSNMGEKNWGNADFTIDGVEQSDVLIANQYIGSARYGVAVKGGPLSAAGRKTNGQISCLAGYIWGAYSPTFLSVTNGGQLLFCGYRSENAQLGLTTLDTASSGRLTWACNNDAVDKYTDTPFRIRGFNGTVCAVANSMWPNGDAVPMFDISGDGSHCRVLSMCNFLGGGRDPNVSIDHLWKDTSNPPAQAATTHCQGIFSAWHWHDVANVTRQVRDVQPDSQFIRDCLQQLRALRLEPPTNRKESVTDIKIIRVSIDVGTGRNGVVMHAN